MTLVERLNAYERLMRLDKPIGTLLLLWPTLWAVWLASDGRPSAGVVVIFVVGTLLMRSAGCAINDYADRDFDPHVKRTRDRPLAAREIEPWEALVIAALLAAAASRAAMTSASHGSISRAASGRLRVRFTCGSKSRSA